MSALKIKNVSIGDKFIKRNKRKDLCTVYAFIERKNIVTGEIIGHECWVKYNFMGQEMTEEVAFSTVVMNRI